MVGLLDIAPSSRTVTVNGAELEVKGVSAGGVAYLLQKFPELRALLAGRDDVDANSLISRVPDAIAAIIASGCGYPGSADAEAKAAELPAEAQMDILAAIVELTMPKGVGPFLEKLTKAMGAFGDADLAKIPGIKSPSPSKS
jgi:hypothetical protein